MAGPLNREQLFATFLLLEAEFDVDTKRRNRIVWTREWIKRRKERGAFQQLVSELVLEDGPAFAEYFRMGKEQFYHLVDAVAFRIKKRDTCMRESVKPNERVAVTLRYLATGETFRSLEYQFRIGRTTITNAVVETCQAIYNELGPKYLKCPDTTDEWRVISEKFHTRWNFPNGLCAVDGKRVNIQKPVNSGSHYHDYKGHESIIAIAAVGPELEIIAADVGTNGRMSDGSNWANNSFRKAIASEDNPLNIPPPKPLPRRNTPVPYVITGDEAFPLTSYLVKPYPKTALSAGTRIYNYRLSRMRRISENVFGIIAQRWRVLRNSILLEPEKVIKIVLAIFTLHNYLRSTTESGKIYIPPGFLDSEDEVTGEIIPGRWRKDNPIDSWVNLSPITCGFNYSQEAKAIRDEFCAYFNNEGAVQWQWRSACIDI